MKKRLNLLSVGVLCVLIFNHIATYTQETDTLWTIKLGGMGYHDEFRYIIKTSDNNYVAAGIFYDEQTQTDLWVIKFNEQGDVIWNKTFITDTVQMWLEEGPRGLVENENGEIAIFVSTAGYTHHVLRLDSDGVQTGIVQYTGPGDPYYPFCGINTADDGYIVAGDQAVAVGNDWVHYGWYRKIDPAGNMEWEHALPPQNWSMRFGCISNLPDGGYILAGEFDPSNNYDDLIFCRIDAQGDTLWTSRWGSDIMDQVYDIAPTADGGYIVAGTKTATGSYYKGFLLKLNHEGSEQWYNTYNSYDEDEIHAVRQSADGGYITTGYHTSASSKPEFWVMKTDGAGNMLQSFFLNPIDYGSVGHCVLQSFDNGYIAAGKAEYEGMIIKLSPHFGNLGIKDNNDLKTMAFRLDQNYPNPFSGSTTINWHSARGAQQSIKVFDGSGRELAVLADGFMPPGDHKVVFPSGNSNALLNNGVYYFQLVSGNYSLTRKMLFLK